VKVLEPLSREQLVVLLRTTAMTTPAMMAVVLCATEADLMSMKLFVHGLGWGAGADDLHFAFSLFGELEDCCVISNKQSGRSKGYGFVLFYPYAEKGKERGVESVVNPLFHRLREE
jgi:heterogeneous nuclear ribonucleoprotein A1/A3